MWEFFYQGEPPFLFSEKVIIMHPQDEVKGYTPIHQVMVSDGWKPVSEITMDDTLMQWNPETQEVTFTKPVSISTTEYSGTLVKILQNRLGGCCHFPDSHTIPVYDFSDKTRENMEFIRVDGFCLGSKKIQVVSGRVTTTGRSTLTPKERMLIAAQADGRETTSESIYLYIKRLHKVDRLFQISADGGYDMRVGAGNVFTVKIGKCVGEQNVKQFDWVDLTQMSPELMIDFIDEVSRWDGVRMAKRLRYNSTNTNTTDKVQAMAHMCGLVSKMYMMRNRVNVETPIQIVEKAKDHRILEIYNYDLRKYVATENMPYTGTLHQIQVPTGFLFIRGYNMIPMIISDCR